MTFVFELKIDSKGLSLFTPYYIKVKPIGPETDSRVLPVELELWDRTCPLLSLS